MECLGVLSIVLQILCFGVTVNSKLHGAFILPHGGIALDPTHFHTNDETAMEEAWKLHRASLTAGETARQLKPDLIILSSPHGIADLNQFMFYLNEKGEGPADTDNCVCPSCCYNVSVQMDYNNTKALLQKLKNVGISVSGISAFGPPGKDNEPFPLRWGEVIPLHFVNSSSTPVIILSMPSQRYLDSVSMIPELLQLGKEMWSFIDSIAERVILVVSGDLCHRFDPNGPFGYSNTSEPFDEAVGQWVMTLNSSHLLEQAAKFVDICYSCGYTGFVMLEGLLSTSRETAGIGWTSDLLANYHPSYYGMMVATFLPSNKKLEL